jgi:hypothetical protein
VDEGCGLSGVLLIDTLRKRKTERKCIGNIERTYSSADDGGVARENLGSAVRKAAPTKVEEPNLLHGCTLRSKSTDNVQEQKKCDNIWSQSFDRWLYAVGRYLRKQ